MRLSNHNKVNQIIKIRQSQFVFRLAIPYRGMLAGRTRTAARQKVNRQGALEKTAIVRALIRLPRQHGVEGSRVSLLLDTQQLQSYSATVKVATFSATASKRVGRISCSFNSTHRYELFHAYFRAYIHRQTVIGVLSRNIYRRLDDNWRVKMQCWSNIKSREAYSNSWIKYSE